MPAPGRPLPLCSQGRFPTRGRPAWVRTHQQVNKTWSYQDGGRFDSPGRWRPVQCRGLQIRIRAEPRAPGGWQGQSAFKRRPSGDRAAPQTAEAPHLVPGARPPSPERSAAKRAPCPLRAAERPPSGSGQVAGSLAPGPTRGLGLWAAFSLKRVGLKFLALEPNVFATGLGLMRKTTFS